VHWYYEKLHFALPVIAKEEFQSQLEALIATPNTDMRDSHFLPVFYAVLALASLSSPWDRDNRRDEKLAALKNADLGTLFFERSVVSNSTSADYGRLPKSPSVRRNLSQVIALIIQAAYLAAIGCQAEAWISIGSATRLAQDLGLHVRGPSHMPQDQLC
jgi:hypothetical protein